MASTLATSIVELLLGFAAAPNDRDKGNRVSLEGLTVASGAEGSFDIRIRSLEAASLRLAFGALGVEVGRCVLHDMVARLRIDGSPRLLSLEAATAELSDVQVRGPLMLLQPGTGSPWRLAPLATADGTIRAK